MWITIRRYVGAFFIYLIYWLTLWGAIRRTIPAILSSDKANEQVEKGIIEFVWEYGWGDHYIWFLILFCLVTFCCAVLAGATAKKNGAIIACISNIPIIAFLSFYCVYLYISQTEIEGSIAWKFVLPVSILGSTLFSIIGGAKGNQWQNNTFSNSTIFGIRPFHWWWFIFPLNLSIQTLVPGITATLFLLRGSALIKDTKYTVLLFLMFAVFATFVYFIIWGWYKTLSLLSAGNRTNVSRFGTVLRILFYLFAIPLLFDVFCVVIYISVRRLF